ncbi:hypothetical protein ACFSL4_21040 [Streptomyces caeni]|uniref:Winged helix DNA-binding domain-containing protein n=1 Tax=Streptomyces caeni TaxID=2307231 RepID=A0ABW4IVT4_9ACTN
MDTVHDRVPRADGMPRPRAAALVARVTALDRLTPGHSQWWTRRVLDRFQAGGPEEHPHAFRRTPHGRARRTAVV